MRQAGSASELALCARIRLAGLLVNEFFFLQNGAVAGIFLLQNGCGFSLVRKRARLKHGSAYLAREMKVDVVRMV